MKACADHRETLMMDVYGELTEEERIAWEKHLVSCGDCRQEREKLRALIAKTKGSHSAAPLTSEEEYALSSSIQRSLRTQKPEAPGKRLGWRIAPALAGCLLVLFAGWFSLNDFRTPDTLTGNADGVLEEQSITENEELLENLDLLQEMESLEQLVNLLDKKYPQTSVLEGQGNANHVRTHV